MIDFNALIFSLSDSALYFKQFPNQGLLLAFSFAFVESLAIIGSLVPGIILMSYVGYLMGVEAISLKLGLTAVMSGAFLGDYLSYLIGKYYRPSIIQMKLYQRNIKKCAYGENLLKKNGIMGMTLGRIIGPVRSTIPLIAGLINMPQKVFFMGATGSVFIWTFCYLSPALLITYFGTELNIDLSKKMLSSLIESIFHITVIAGITRYYFSQKKNKQPLKQSVALCAAFGHIILLLKTHSEILILNNIILAMAHAYHSSWGLTSASFLSISADKYTLYGFCCLATVVLAVHKQYQHIILFTIATLGVGLSIKYVKILVNYPRPDFIIHLLGPTAFPSGHTGLYATIAFILCHLLCEHHREKSPFIWRIGILSTFFIMLARLYLGSHWFTDVMGGLIIGQLFYLIPYQIMAPKINPLPLSKHATHQLIVVFFLVCLLTPILRFNIPTLTEQYDPKHYEVLNLKHIYNNDAFKKETPLSIQYAQNALGIPLYPLTIQAQTPLSQWTKMMAPAWGMDENTAFPNLSVLGQRPSHILKHHTHPHHFIVLWVYPHLIKNDQPLIVGFMFQQNKQGIQVIDARPFLGHVSLNIEHHHTKNIYTQLQGWNGNIYKIQKETL